MPSSTPPPVKPAAVLSVAPAVHHAAAPAAHHAAAPAAHHAAAPAAHHEAASNAPSTKTSDEVIAELLEQIRELKEHTKELTEKTTKLNKHTKELTEKTTKLDENVKRLSFGVTIQPEIPIASTDITERKINRPTEWLTHVRVGADRVVDAMCNCNCRRLVRGGTTVGHGVSLGMGSARDVGALGAAELAILDQGLIAIARRLIPRKAGSLPGATAAAFPHLVELFASASIPVINWNNDNSPGAFVNFRNPARHGNQRLHDGLTGFRSQANGHPNERLAYETIFQMIQFRGINLDTV